MAKNEKNWFARHKVLTVIGVIVLLAIIGAAMGGGNQPNTTQPQQTQTKTGGTTEEEQGSSEWEPAAAYKKINNGMTKAQVEKITGKESQDCIESAVEGLGTSETCSYGGFSDKGQITVTYSNGKVESKTKTNF